MLRIKPAFIVTALTFVLSGCEQHSGVNEAASPPSYISKTNPSAPAAVPPGDPSVPSATEALARPKADTTPMPTSNATPNERTGEMPTAGQTPGGSSESSVTPTEEKGKMPLPGQANDHSTPEFAKKGDGITAKTDEAPQTDDAGKAAKPTQ